MITIIADDLTGAAEVAGVCLRYGLRTAFGVNALPNEQAEAWVIATDSRSMTEKDARELHQHLAEELKAAGRKSVFKKTDSVLRGHVIAELSGLMDVYGINKVLLQPSNPAVGRCVKAGKYLIDSIPLHETSFATDPDFPAKNASVNLLLQSRSMQLYRKRTDFSIYTKLPVSDRSLGIYIPDCETKNDLKNDLSTLGDEWIYAGSAAFFAAYLEEKIELKVQAPTEKINPFHDNFLMVCGSAHAQSRKFIEETICKGGRVAELPAAFLTANVDEVALTNWVDEQINVWQEDNSLILKLSSDKITFPNSATVLKNRLAKIVNRLLQHPTKELMIEGGATAYAILIKQGWSTLVPLQELSPGVVRMAVSQYPGLFLTLKPGSYKWPENGILN